MPLTFITFIVTNHHLTDNLHKSTIRKVKRCEVYLSFRDNIWSSDLADMQLINKCITECELFYVPDVFQKCLAESDCKLK